MSSTAASDHRLKKKRLTYAKIETILDYTAQIIVQERPSTPRLRQKPTRRRRRASRSPSSRVSHDYQQKKKKPINTKMR